MLLPSLTQAINTYLRLDPESKKRINKLHGKTITIEFLPFHFIFQCVFHEDHMQLKSEDALPTDTKIRGTPLQMLGVMITKEHRGRFFADDIHIEGDAEVGQQVIELFDELDIDWGDHLAKCVGDIPAYHVSQMIKGVTHWLRNADKTFAQNVNEYIHEESQFLPVREALQDFFNDIDLLRMDVDRMEAKLNILRASLETPSDDEVRP